MCPVCGKPLVSYEIDGLEIDRCLACGGTWLDAGEIEFIAERAGASAGKLRETIEKAQGEKHGKRRCVRCGAKLREIQVAGVTIDRCPRGHGLWLDRGETETLVTSFNEGEEGAVARFFKEIYRAERPGKGD